MQFLRNAPVLGASCIPIEELQVLRAIRISSFYCYNSLNVMLILVL